MSLARLDQCLILVNGLPGSGKTTLARALATHLSATLISKDAIKEALADSVPGVDSRRAGRIASDVMWDVAAAVDGAVIVESFWFQGRDDRFFAQGIERSGRAQAVEVWCSVAVEVARSRYITRERHAVHDDRNRLDDWEHWAGAHPMTETPLVVPTVQPVAIDDVAGRLLDRGIVLS